MFNQSFKGERGLRDLEKLLVDLLQGIDSLFELDVVRWELSLDGEYLSLCLDCRRKDCDCTLSSAVPICSLKYCCVRAANGEMEDLGTSGH